MILLIEGITQDQEDSLIQDKEFMDNCKQTDLAEDTVIVTDGFGNKYKMWDHQVEEFIEISKEFKEGHLV